MEYYDKKSVVTYIFVCRKRSVDLPYDEEVGEDGRGPYRREDYVVSLSSTVKSTH